ncbi:MAG TPA: shikimate kinase [Gemmatimonadales bacterium]|nr:shikimate kinase [Gemmatimonadales bacterium]
MPRHIVLVGLPGAGKSSVGKLVAEALNTFVIDIDALLVREMGMPVSQIIGMVGEPRFREMERDAVNTAQARDPCVIVPGGGWAAQPGQLEAAKHAGLVIYLRCLPSTALKRCERGEARPLLAGGDPGQRMQALFAEREPFYKLAHHQINTENTAPEAVAAEVMALARQHGGWFARSGP